MPSAKGAKKVVKEPIPRLNLKAPNGYIKQVRAEEKDRAEIMAAWKETDYRRNWRWGNNGEHFDKEHQKNAAAGRVAQMQEETAEISPMFISIMSSYRAR